MLTSRKSISKTQVRFTESKLSPSSPTISDDSHSSFRHSDKESPQMLTNLLSFARELTLPHAKVNLTKTKFSPKPSLDIITVENTDDYVKIKDENVRDSYDEPQRSKLLSEQSPTKNSLTVVAEVHNSSESTEGLYYSPNSTFSEDESNKSKEVKENINREVSITSTVEGGESDKSSVSLPKSRPSYRGKIRFLFVLQ